ncbi:hypothetical protein PVMG_05519 [Plasmodium vivax Mauritania I]|uniref:VIR protein n=1 Tax=Plasmodium vivax Mauritania I TaxID=1035515 RepID=A0A0J9W3P7_PLAVI|nr:hypothetical protein PVMG_05519 [Plasmodium vivax Mauritania I]
MPKNATDEVYLHYDDYFTVKEKSDKSKNYEYSYLKAEDILDYAEVDQSLRSRYGAAYKDIFRHLYDHHIMSNYMKQGCKYISYLLHKEITKNDKYDFKTYEILFDYAKNYYKHQKSKTTLCLDNMLYIDYDMFDKVNALYGLYDYYINFLNNNKNWKDSSCASLKALAHAYNDYMMNHPSTSIYLNGILEHFKTKINRTIENNKTKCTDYDYNYNLTPIKLFVDPKVKQPITKGLISPPDVNNLRDTSTDIRETQLKGPTEDHMTQEVRRIEAAEETEPTLDTQKTVEIEQSTETQTIPSASYNYGTVRAHAPNEPFRHLKLLHAGEPSEESALIRESTFRPQTELKKDEGFFSNVQSTLSGFINEVEPAPILGVSGGMGALFLLFKVL